MNVKDLYKRFVYYTAVPKCASCREILDFEDKALCKSCLSEYRNIKMINCSRCAKTYDKCICSFDYLEKHFVKRLAKVFRYKHPEGANDRIPSNELIYNLKRERRTDIIEFLTDELERSLAENLDLDGFVITNVPRKKSRTLKYGLDHSAELAKSLGKRLGIEYVSLLESKLARAQKKTRGDERIKNAKFDYRRSAPDVKGKRVLLLDDIVTTGASMGNSATLIKGLGAKEIVGVCVSIAYKDKYVPFEKSSPF